METRLVRWGYSNFEAALRTLLKDYCGDSATDTMIQSGTTATRAIRFMNRIELVQKYREMRVLQNFAFGPKSQGR